MRHKNALPLGFLLQRYRIKTILGHGGFGITYLALDEALNQRVAIKEYLPNEFAVRDAHNVVVAKSEEDRKTFQGGWSAFHWRRACWSASITLISYACCALCGCLARLIWLWSIETAKR